ncbi:uncharacterized protein MYCFIDRAFT_205520 [Pseudocercospora fijiensis CIRAD86]|uniref:Uncharacterized protein n=1 Tax=Pseudocercospora fijiensis (strain CIRAD86) TaxID=383855 RepID=M2ZY71_PSEFD|nr:uncharacterized protein MYCFIDRAFT_205520 [Pseudocercospora fijiensis CIRAD86]EME77066.1 hypothetical protein MYCFIDRAFT_205520 [Pseudocercospora fijiensis CIRAD86]
MQRCGDANVAGFMLCNVANGSTGTSTVACLHIAIEHTHPKMLSTTQTPASHVAPPQQPAYHNTSAGESKTRRQPYIHEQDNRACQNCADVQKAIEAMQEDMQELEDLL